MLDRLKELERQARPLEPDEAQRRRLMERVSAYAQGFLENLEGAPAFVEDSPGERRKGLHASPLSEEGIGLDEALELIAEHVDKPGVNPASGRFLGYIPGGGLYYSALGDFLAAVANRYAGIFFASPGAVRMENMLLGWMGDLVGYPRSRGGNITSGGSIANLMGVVAARDAHEVEGEAVSRAVVYLTEHTHHSVDKALRIAGMGNCVVRRVPVDRCYRMRPEVLQQTIAADRKKGLRPWLLVAAAGSTNTGSVDPLTTLGQIAREQGLWYHVDGAYGGFFILCDEGRRKLQGIELSDSVVMDPHKTLFLPYGTGTVLVRDRATLMPSHHYTADYMQDTERAVEELSPAEVSPELTKHFRGMRLWLPLKVVGLAPFRAALEEKMLLARYFHRELQAVEGFEVGPEPDLSVVIYRYVPRRGDPDAFNERLAQALQQDGRVFVSSTRVQGKFVLRAAIVSFRTHLDDVQETIAVLRETAKALESLS
ncbi:MAG TPA: aminotransferase class V-fold PLP-dependent enzyme [Candidatus Sulfomarinibacteraceae bacterium]|nr:aminotransferase class V-fold PLP-dependent enzyme [Candidatus Sulfomarinibacteraceae bacterium]